MSEFATVPQSLTDYLLEQLEDGKKITSCTWTDGQAWIVECPNINWIILIQWVYGADDWGVVNLNGSLAKHLRQSLKHMPCLEGEHRT